MNKKVFAIALAAMMCGAVNAQQVTSVSSVNITLTQFNIDSLKAAAPDVASYVVLLQGVEDKLKADKKAIDLAEKNLQAEEKLYQSQEKLLKERDKQIAAQEKMLDQQMKTYEKDRKEIEKEQKQLSKKSNIDAATQNGSLQLVNERAAKNAQLIQECQQKQQEVQRQRDQYNADVVKLTDFKTTINQKKNEISMLRSENQMQMQTIQNELKVAKAAAKGK